MAWKPTAQFKGNVTGTGTSLTIGTYSAITGVTANPGPYTSILVLTTIISHTTCTALSDNVNGSHTKMTSIAQGNGKGELSIWKIGPLDYPVNTSVTITATISAGADTQSIGTAVFLQPDPLTDKNYTGGVLNNTSTATGTRSDNIIYTISNSIVCDANTQFIWTYGSSHDNGKIDDGYETGGGGDINNLHTYIGNSLFSTWRTETQGIWVPITPLGTGSRTASYDAAASSTTGSWDWVATAASFTKPDLGMFKFFTPVLSFLGNLKTNPSTKGNSGNLSLNGNLKTNPTGQPLAGGLSFSGQLQAYNKTQRRTGTLTFGGTVTTIKTTPNTSMVAKPRPVGKSQLRSKSLSQQRPAAILQSRYTPLKAVQRTTTQLDSIPKDVDVAVTETYPYQVDVTNYLSSGDSISSITSVLTFLSTGAVVTSAWQGTVTSAGNIIQVIINAPVLQLGQQYQLATTFTAVAGKRLTVLSYLNIVA